MSADSKIVRRLIFRNFTLSPVAVARLYRYYVQICRCVMFVAGQLKFGKMFENLHLFASSSLPFISYKSVFTASGSQKYKEYKRSIGCTVDFDWLSEYRYPLHKHRGEAELGIEWIYIR